MKISWITIHGAREHNLKNVSVRIPRDSFVVVTGVSGSGKSTLAFDLLYAEGQRRFLDSMSAYARQFVQQLPRPDVDLVDGLPPSVSIEQRNSRGGGKSTVGTVTEIHQFVRLLFARLGIQYCPGCDIGVEPQTRDQLTEMLTQESRRRGEQRVFAPLIRGRKGFHSTMSTWAKAHGYSRLRADGEMYSVDAPFKLDRFREHHVEVEIGTIPAKGGNGSHIEGIVDEALRVGKGVLYSVDEKGKESVHSTDRVCPSCQKSFDLLDPKDFSYNSAKGWCPSCRGFGEVFHMPETDRGANEDAIEDSWFRWKEGERERCSDCDGGRLNAVSRSVFLSWGGGALRGRTDDTAKGYSIDAIGAMTVDEAAQYFCDIKPNPREIEIARDILPEIRERLRFLAEVGLGYLQLGRGVTTLSGGENQRIRLAAQLGSNLSGVLYVLDEPTIGLHVRDNDQLLKTLKRLKDRGNSLVVVEHDEDTIRAADYVVDLGPGAGVEGGEIVGAAPFKELLKMSGSVTASCLRSEKKFPLRGERRPVGKKRGKSSSKIGVKGSDTSWMRLTEASGNNLKNIDVSIPLNRLVVVSGVSGSGKSTLIRHCLLPALCQLTGQEVTKSIDEGRSLLEMDPGVSIGRVYEIDQTPIGRTPRSIPATYVGIFDLIRKVFSQIPEARMRGYGPGRFSFNSKAGRCPECEGAGVIKMEMAFMPAAYVHCESCDGTRYGPETLAIRYRGKTIGEVLDLSIAEAFDFFEAFNSIQRALGALIDTGLGYLRLGQTSPTLSGGEAQRLKLVTHLLGGMKGGQKGEGMTLKKHVFLLEEPTIGLHIIDVHRLLSVLQRLVDQGHSVIVIEHNLDVIAEADWIIDLGPEGGDAGGRIVVEGAPERVAHHTKSHTGRYLDKFLNQPFVQ
jgi:excinuclease ABC subunit A